MTRGFAGAVLLLTCFESFAADAVKGREVTPWCKYVEDDVINNLPPESSEPWRCLAAANYYRMGFVRAKDSHERKELKFYLPEKEWAVESPELGISKHEIETKFWGGGTVKINGGALLDMLGVPTTALGPIGDVLKDALPKGGANLTGELVDIRRTSLIDPHYTYISNFSDTVDLKLAAFQKSDSVAAAQLDRLRALLCKDGTEIALEVMTAIPEMEVFSSVELKGAANVAVDKVAGAGIDLGGKKLEKYSMKSEKPVVVAYRLNKTAKSDFESLKLCGKEFEERSKKKE